MFRQRTCGLFIFFFEAEEDIRDSVASRGRGDVDNRQNKIGQRRAGFFKQKTAYELA